MKLASKKGLIVTYLEGTILAGSILLTAHYWKDYSFSLNFFIPLALMPFWIILLDRIFAMLQRSSVATAAAVMGASAILETLPTTPLLLRLTLAAISWACFWFILTRANKDFFPEK